MFSRKINYLGLLCFPNFMHCKVTKKGSDRVRAVRCAFSHIKLKKRALFSGQMREFRI